MEVNPITLAALATSAVPGLEVTSFQEAKLTSTNERSVLLGSSHGNLLLKVPLDPTAEVKESAERLSLTALSEGMRAALSFEAPEVLGVIGVADTRAVITSYLPGSRIEGLSFSSNKDVLFSVARAISELHGLPKRNVIEHGLSSLSVSEIREEAERTIERVNKTGYLPFSVYERWNEVLLDSKLWDFHPAVIHGNLDEDQFLFADDEVTGVIGWSEMKVSDPAIDLSWISFSPHWDEILAEYLKSADSTNADALTARSIFWSEYQVANWLLFGVDSRNDEIIKDAVEMFDQLVDSFVSEADTQTAEDPAADPIDVLQRTPHERVKSGSVNGDEFDELEEDRILSTYDDFKDSEKEEHSEEGQH